MRHDKEGMRNPRIDPFARAQSMNRLMGFGLGVLAVVAILGAMSGSASPRGQRGSEPQASSQPMPRGYSIPLIDLAAQTERQVVVDREAGQYLGHPTTVLLEDCRTIIAVYPRGHGRGPIVMKRPSSWNIAR